MNSDSPNAFLEAVQKHLPGYVSAIFTGAFFVCTLIFNYSGKSQHSQDVQADQQRRIELLEKDTATRRELDAVKATVDRIEQKLDGYRDEELKYHHGRP